MLPKVERDVIIPIMREMGDPEWADDLWNRLIKEQPILAEYLNMMKERVSGEAILMGLCIFRFLEAQLEVNILEEMFG